MFIFIILLGSARLVSWVYLYCSECFPFNKMDDPQKSDFSKNLFIPSTNSVVGNLLIIISPPETLHSSKLCHGYATYARQNQLTDSIVSYPVVGVKISYSLLRKKLSYCKSGSWNAWQSLSSSPKSKIPNSQQRSSNSQSVCLSINSNKSPRGIICRWMANFIANSKIKSIEARPLILCQQNCFVFYDQALV